MKNNRIDRTNGNDIVIIKTKEKEKCVSIPAFGRIEIIVHNNEIKEIVVIEKERI